MNLSTWFELIEHWLMLIGIFAKQDKYPPLWNLVLVSPFVPKDIWVLWIETPCTSRYKYSESHWLINPETESDEQDVHDIEGELNVLQSWDNRWPCSPSAFKLDFLWCWWEFDDDDVGDDVDADWRWWTLWRSFTPDGGLKHSTVCHHRPHARWWWQSTVQLLSLIYDIYWVIFSYRK